MKRITSRQNPLVARFRAVTQGDDRTLLLLDGVHLVAEALAAGSDDARSGRRQTAMDDRGNRARWSPGFRTPAST